MSDTIQHHGIPGMRWGVRRTKNQLGNRSSTKKNTEEPEDGKTTASKQNTKKGSTSTNDNKPMLSDEELRRAVNRLQLEKQYKDLMKINEQVTISKGRKFVMDVLASSGKTVANELTTHALRSMVNKIAGEEILGKKKEKKKDT